MTRLALALALLPLPALAMPVNVLEVVDGDTIRVEIRGNEPGWDVFDVRLVRLNTPESRSRCDTEAERERERELAARATQYVRERVRAAEVVDVKRQGEDGFNRPLVEVTLDGESLNDTLLAEGYAIPYRPGTHGKAWCGR
ncbi:thermonuclease family protein [Modicisalibacter coralii]|uniref:thermonuclease family protein n=1 Tax=Modicisalibacter coralii TaxID=2304602 RepID=UPI00100A2649|nr:thermonuclease family protein [Halomonas coralii]